MKLVIHYLKPFIFIVILSLILLFMQAMADLALPNLMSNIVNVDIQQSGIEETLPVAMSEDSFELIQAFIGDDNKEAFKNAYVNVESGSDEANKYIDSYPLLKQSN